MVTKLDEKELGVVTEKVDEIAVNGVEPAPLDMEEYNEKYNAKVELGTYGESWSKDLILIGHNAIRNELMDIQKLLLYFFEENFQVKRSLLENFFPWWDDFVDLVGEYFDYEEVVFFPWVSERAVIKPERYGIHMRLHMKSKLILVMRKIDSYHQSFLYAAPGEKLPEFSALLRFFCEALNEYLKYEEKKIRTTIAARYKEPDVAAYLKRMERFLMTADNLPELYILFTRNVKHREYFPVIAEMVRAQPMELQKAMDHFKFIDQLIGKAPPNPSLGLVASSSASASRVPTAVPTSAPLIKSSSSKSVLDNLRRNASENSSQSSRSVKSGSGFFAKALSRSRKGSKKSNG